jgi:hypothetical protein
MAITLSGSGGITFPDTTTQSTGKQACKAWVNFNGTGTVAIRDSFNVSSITDNGTGDYTINFTTAMPSANYSAVGTCQSQTYDKSFVAIPNTGSTYTTTQVRLICVAFNGSSFNNNDATIFNVAVFSS